MPQKSANYWASTENNRNNAWNVNSNDGNTNGNNKYNSLTVRAAVAYGGFKEAIKAVYEAYLDCKRGKMSSPYTIAYIEIAVDDLPRLAYEIYTVIYKPTVSICFLVKYPKLREVFAADFRDRIVHHWIIIRLEPLFERRFQQMGNISFNTGSGQCCGKGNEGSIRELHQAGLGVQRRPRKLLHVYKERLVVVLTGTTYQKTLRRRR